MSRGWKQKTIAGLEALIAVESDRSDIVEAMDADMPAQKRGPYKKAAFGS